MPRRDELAKRDTMKQAFTQLMGVLFLAAFVLGAVVGTRDLIRALQSKQWPTTTGTIIAAAIEKRTGSRTGSPPAYHGRVTYRYTVDGVPHTSSQVSYGEHGESGKGHAQSVLARYPAGRSVRVFYRSDSPAVAVIEPGAGFFNWIFPGVCLRFARAA